MATVGEAVAALGIEERGGWEAIIVRPKDGRWQHYPLATVAAKPLDGDLYAATGLFYPDRVGMWEGRRGENVAQIVALPLDVDLKDWLPAPLDEVLAYPDDVIEAMLPRFRADVEETLAAIGLPWHRCLYTGHGLAYAVNVPPHPPERAPEIRDWHGRIVDRINSVSRLPLVDPAVRDAGTRLLRLPGSVNTKSPRYPRTVRVLEERPGAIDEATLIAAAGGAGMRPTPPPRIVPKTGEAFSLATERMIVDHVAPHWSKGERHRLALAISGLFAKANVPEEQTTRIVEALSAGDEEARDRLRAVHTTYERVRSGLAARGFHELALSLPSPLVSWLDEQAQAVRAASAPRITIVGGKRVSEPVASATGTKEPVPEECFVGWLKDYVDLVHPLCEAPPVYHLAAGMALVGATMGRTVAARYVSRNIHPNLYVMFVGLAGTARKDTAIEFALDMPFHRPANPAQTPPIQCPFTVATDVGSAEGLVSLLSREPNVLLYITELQRLVRNARRQSTGTIFPLLTTAWNTPVTIQNVTKGNPLEARFPCLSIMAAVQPNILAQEFQQEDIESGFATRWLYVPGAGGDPLPDPRDVDHAVAFRLYRELLTVRQRYAAVEGGQRLYLDDAASAIWTDWYMTDLQREVASEDEASMRSRLGVHVRKVALVYAAAESATEITPKHLEPAIAFVEWVWRQTRQMMRTWGVGVWTQIEQRIEHVLAEHDGPMLRRDLAYRCRGRRWSAREFTQVLDAMVKNGTVESLGPGMVSWAG